jgi:hypothetical protein
MGFPSRKRDRARMTPIAAPGTGRASVHAEPEIAQPDPNKAPPASDYDAVEDMSADAIRASVARRRKGA